MAGFNYNQLNIVGRDEQTIGFLQRTMLKELEKLQEKVSPQSEAFKNIVNVANDVWSGADKDLFINRITAAANDFSESLTTLINNINKAFSKDFSDFNTLTSQTKKIVDKK